ncbi:MAG: hypothetical protein WD226_06765 [Planctomycetota bacterium]
MPRPHVHRVTSFGRALFSATRASLIAAAIAAGTASGLAAQIVVPTDAPNLAAAVDLAEAGETIFVRTSEPQAPVIVAKPLTIVGQPRAYIEVPCGEHAGVLLAGEGFGRVVLSQMDIVLGAECAFPDAGIAGTGFRELFLDDCLVDTRWSAFGGVTYGTPAIAVDLPLLTLHATRVFGGGVDADACIGPLPGGGHPGVLAPNADVVLHDSEVQGGAGGYLCCEWCSCPTSPLGWGGEGGTAVVASNLYLIDSNVAGGQGAVLDAFPGFEFDGGAMRCATQPNGAAFDVQSARNIVSDLAGTGPLGIGQRWALEWPGSADFAWLIGSMRHTVPWELGGPDGFGTVFVDLNALFLQELVYTGDGSARYELTVPPVLELIGTSVVFQVFEAGPGLSSPVYRVIG